MSPQWEDGLELDVDNDCEDETDHVVDGKYDDGAAENGAKDHISEVREGSLWVSLRDCLSPADVLVLRAAWVKMEQREVVWEICCFMVLPHDKNGGEEAAPAPLPEWPSLCFDYRQNFGFDSYRTWPPLETQESGPELARGNSWCQVEKHLLQRVCCKT